MGVKMPFRMLVAVGGRLVKAHRIGKRDIKNLVVGRSHLLQNFAQPDNLVLGELVHAPRWRRLQIIISNGHTAQKGTRATNPSFSQITRTACCSSSPM